MASSSASPEAASEEEKAVHETKIIQFFGRNTPIILQKDNGPCPLLAICNFLSLKGELGVSTSISKISQENLLSLVAARLLDTHSNINNKDGRWARYWQKKIDAAIELLPKLAKGIHMNIGFKRIDDFELTLEREIFYLLDIPLYHGWIMDTKDKDTARVIGSKSYNDLANELAALDNRGTKTESMEKSEEERVDFAAATAATPVSSTPEEGVLIHNFFHNTNQLTIFGLKKLQDDLEEGELCVLFRNNHFNTMFKFEGALYVLATDQVFKDYSGLVWEKLTQVDGNTAYVTSDFKEFNGEDHNDTAWDEQIARASAAAYIIQLEKKVKELKEENERLQQKEIPVADKAYQTSKDKRDRAKIFLETETLTGSKTEHLQTELRNTEGKVDNASLEDGKTKLKIYKRKPDWLKSRVVAKKRIAAYSSNRSPIKTQNNSPTVQKDVTETSHAMVVKDGARSDELQKDPVTGHKKGLIVNISPSGSSSSQHTKARDKIQETLCLYRLILSELSPQKKSESEEVKKSSRIDHRAKNKLEEIMGKIEPDKNLIGSVPGVQVGDEFQYRVELAIVGLHRLHQAGIDTIKQDGKVIATSIVASGAYSDNWKDEDVLIYTGQGGNVVGKKVNKPEDQKLEQGNLALFNSVKTKNPVRVVRGGKETKASDSSKGVKTIYVYKGLYTVEKCWMEKGSHGKMVYKFELRRFVEQELAGKEVKDADISGGQEKSPIRAVNSIDDEKPPAFIYIREMKYPCGIIFTLPRGCSCRTTCSDSEKCSCRLKNGGKIPYNHDGALVELKTIVYECGPSCTCPPTCINRVSQHGIKIQLEIFKTENRGWGVRPLTSIPSGSFICEYAGELLNDREPELRAGTDEYLFGIGKKKPDPSTNDMETVEEADSYTVNAAMYGNVGRFINHSCSPNLHAQEVLYDHYDKNMAHVMFFAAVNIPPFQEITFDYNYLLKEVCDSDEKIKVKSCYCGSTQCRGRLY